MEITGMTLAGLYTIAATVSVLSRFADAAKPQPADGTTASINCSAGETASASVARPNTTVSVTCAENSTVQPSVSGRAGENVYLGAACTKPAVLSSVCPGATLEPAAHAKASGSPDVNVFIPQLPGSAQVVCLVCHPNNASGDCRAVINVAAAPPQGPQACAVAGSSVTLQINEAGGSAQFACGAGFSLAPEDATKAYADDCAKEETLEDMKRSPTPGNYFTLKVDKLKNKKLCYLCKRGADAGKKGGEQNPCTIYVEVSGSTRLYSGVRLYLALLCVAAMLRFA